MKNLIINVPPGSTKSLLTFVFWPAWVWIDNPAARWLFSSHRSDLAVRDSVKCRRLIESPWYQDRWAALFELTSDQNTTSRFENSRTGYWLVVPVTGGTGERGDFVVCDYPHSVDGAESDAERRAAVDWWNGTMSTRLNDFATGHKVVIQQRLHEADVTGNLVEAKADYELLMLQAEFEPERCCKTSIGWADPRSKAGELLWPEKVTQPDLEALKATLGSYRYAGQYQQRPSPVGGGIFQRHWFRYWRPAHLALQSVQVRMPDGTYQSIQAVPLPDRFE